ncbi:MAG: CvpA family protein [Silicimonas sp.]|nr:CvpA family protein [Silicimonas sp.]NNF92379.1 CvpA family protein [Boseongicola sp.]RZW09956.1 MAG: CvpA family protein [Paracoccaceae bacterium]MBT8424440.1 CvpA family protein [Silicimonas sp.]NND19579.1 CvpA family protein [Silicimonas sp.]
MEGFTIIDGIVAVIIILSAVLAYSRGFVREALSIGGWILAAIAAYVFAPTVEPLMKEVPILKDFLGPSCELSMIAAFAAVFALALIIVSVFTPLFAGAVQRSALGGIDQGFGFLFGAARGVLLVVIAFIVYERVIVSDPIPMVDESRTAIVFAQISEAIDEQIPEDAPGWIAERYDDLIGQCSAGSDT